MKYPFDTSLFDEKTFYPAFTHDILSCKEEIIIESPFITSSRMKGFQSVFKKMLEEGVKIYVFTRDSREHDYEMAYQTEMEIQNFERIGIQTVLCTGNHHRKLTILDKNIQRGRSLTNKTFGLQPQRGAMLFLNTD